MLVKYFNKRKPSELFYFAFGLSAIVFAGVVMAKIGLGFSAGASGIAFWLPASIAVLFSIFLLELLIVLRRKIVG